MAISEKLAKIHAKRNGAIKEADEILTRARAAVRELTEEEARQFDTLMGSLDGYTDALQAVDPRYGDLPVYTGNENRSGFLNLVKSELNGTLDVQVDLNSDDVVNENRERFYDATTGHKYRCFGSKEPLTNMRHDQNLDFARAIIERCTGQKLLTPERRALQVDANVDGGYLASYSAGLGLLELARAKTGVARAGARTIPINGSDEVTLAMVTGDPTFSWARELQRYDLDESTAFGCLKLKANKVITQVEASYEFMKAPNAANMLMDLLSASLAAEIDRVALVGDPGESGGACPTGIVNTSGVLSTAATGGTISYDQLLDVLGSLQAANVDPNAMILPPAVNTLIAKLKDGNGNYQAAPGDLVALSKIVSSKMTASALIMGSFEDLILVPFGRMEVNTAKDLKDRRGAYLIEVVSYFDCGVVWPGHFAKLTGITD